MIQNFVWRLLSNDAFLRFLNDRCVLIFVHRALVRAIILGVLLSFRFYLEVRGFRLQQVVVLAV